MYFYLYITGRIFAKDKRTWLTRFYLHELYSEPEDKHEITRAVQKYTGLRL